MFVCCDGCRCKSFSRKQTTRTSLLQLLKQETMPLTSKQKAKQTTHQLMSCDLDSKSPLRHVRYGCDSPLYCPGFKLTSPTMVTMTSQGSGCCNIKEHQHRHRDTFSRHLSESIRSTRSLLEKDCFYYISLHFFTFRDLQDPSERQTPSCYFATSH